MDSQTGELISQVLKHHCHKLLIPDNIGPAIGGIQCHVTSVTSGWQHVCVCANYVYYTVWNIRLS